MGRVADCDPERQFVAQGVVVVEEAAGFDEQSTGVAPRSVKQV